ncbi:hypothetical protein L9F63_023526, partial [Diploptera punctata]
DTSNNDVFGVSVIHEKATLSRQGCMDNTRLPLSIRRLHQDECRELKRRGLDNVMNTGGRVLRRDSEEKLKFTDIKNELMKRSNVSRPGKVVTISLMDNEVELIGSTIIEKDVSNLENKKFTVLSHIKANVNCQSEKESKQSVSTRSCPSLKIEKTDKNILTSSDLNSSIKCQNYKSKHMELFELF